MENLKAGIIGVDFRENVYFYAEYIRIYVISDLIKKTIICITCGVKSKL